MQDAAGAAPPGSAPAAGQPAPPKPPARAPDATVDSKPAPAGPVPAPAASLAAPARPAANPALLAMLLRRGNGLLVLGDVSGARRFYERAAESGSAEAAEALARTYDPAALATLGARGIQPDPEAAAAWYRRAAALWAAERGLPQDSGAPK
ncbi:SEL1-like repeat protein [Siccirubricoccus sp. G192]|uniref:SEL1-like repeat protein n=1 Tax=Siccirubricoccus sp. G192 TaxID=2849651 RepID=UPI001C2C1B11|nr:SEL1-like repeat protein [Siccirubricoccus sp. G192]MBV1797909.1 SEL1-like repeat protein [Siccirubricoccus sp. G192]